MPAGGPEKIRDLLNEGRSVVWIMEQTRWQRKHIVAQAHALQMLINPDTDVAEHITEQDAEDARETMRAAARATASDGPTQCLHDRALAEARDHYRAPVRTAAERAERWFDELTALLAETRQADEMLRRVAAQRAKLDADIERLKQERAQLMSAVSGSQRRFPPKASPAQIESARANFTKTQQRLKDFLDRHQVKPKDVRAWAADNGFEISYTGMISSRILDAYDEAHQTDEAAS